MTNNVRFTFRVPKELQSNIKKEAEKKGVSVNAQMLQILWDWLKNKEK